jgi:hypothetical protein
MKTKSIALAVATLLVSAAPLSSQIAPGQTSDIARARRDIAISLLRNINTTEVTYKSRHGGAYAAWDALLASEEFHGSKVLALLAKYDSQLLNTQFSTAPEILPGWSLRLNLTADAQGYDLLLEDTTDKTCGYAAITGERGVIRQSKAIDCDI